MNPGSKIDYSFQVNSGDIDFYIFDGQNAYNWDQGNDYTPEFFLNDVSSYTNTFIANDPEGKDYYLLWYNDGSPSGSRQVNYDINYTAVDVYNLSAADYSKIKETLIEDSRINEPRRIKLDIFIFLYLISYPF